MTLIIIEACYEISTRGSNGANDNLHTAQDGMSDAVRYRPCAAGSRVFGAVCIIAAQEGGLLVRILGFHVHAILVFLSCLLLDILILRLQ